MSHVCSACRGQKKVLGLLGLELQIILRHHVDTRNQDKLSEKQQVFLIGEPSLQACSLPFDRWLNPFTFNVILLLLDLSLYLLLSISFTALLNGVMF